jgi:hypothetical protein
MPYLTIPRFFPKAGKRSGGGIKGSGWFIAILGIISHKVVFFYLISPPPDSSDL